MKSLGKQFHVSFPAFCDSIPCRFVPSCVLLQLDPNRGEAWANLGGIYLHLHQWDRGFSALEQALRLERKDWRVWSNFLVACMRSRHFSRALHAMTQLVDMRHSDPDKNDGVDIPCLGLLVQVIRQPMR
jgi:tetratricopeptide (TPR) repeat protein